MHHLSLCPRRKALSLEWSKDVTLVRFFALLRIKPHAPPLVRPPSIPLSFNLAVVLPAEFNAFVQRLKGGNPPTLSTHRLRRDYQVSNPVCSPRVSYRPESRLRVPISTHFTATHGIPLFCTQVSPVSTTLPRLSRGFHIRLKKPRSLYAQ